MKGIRFLLPALLLLLFLPFSGLTFMEGASVSLAVFAFLRFLDGLGKRFVIVDFIAVLATTMWLIVPIIFFHIYNKRNTLARIWDVYIPVDSNEYYSYVLPATGLMLLGLYFPARYTQQNNHSAWIQQVKQYLIGKESITYVLLGIGLFASLIDILAPTSLAFVFKLASNLIYVAALYALYSKLRSKKIIFITVFMVLLVNSIGRGMFGEMVYLVALTLIVFLVGLKKKYSFSLKLGILTIGFIAIILLQSIKHTYRDITWLTAYEGSKIGLFSELLLEKILNPSQIFNNEYALFSLSVRANQGLMIGQVMDYIPTHKDISYGEDIGLAILSSFVPRFIWPTKPEVGGRYNMERYTGKIIRLYSMNVSPVGEAYGNFGRAGGIIFMFFYGLFFSWAVSKVLKLSIRYPTAILWIPFFFYYSVVVETDVLTVLNSLLKATFFAWVVYGFFSVFFKIKI